GLGDLRAVVSRHQLTRVSAGTLLGSRETALGIRSIHPVTYEPRRHGDTELTTYSTNPHTAQACDALETIVSHSIQPAFQNRFRQAGSHHGSSLPVLSPLHPGRTRTIRPQNPNSLLRQRDYRAR